MGARGRALTQIADSLAHRHGPQQFRFVLSHVPTGVVVVTGRRPSGPVGLAIGSFTSISLDPPLVGFYPDRSSTSWPPIRSSGSFCVNVLADDQAELCRRFARSGGDKFEALRWRPAPGSGAPILEGVLAWIDCDLERETEIGDHSLVVGSVRALTVERDAHPLVFFRGGHPTLRL